MQRDNYSFLFIIFIGIHELGKALVTMLLGLTQVAGARNNKYLYNSKELQTELGQYDYSHCIYSFLVVFMSSAEPRLWGKVL